MFGWLRALLKNHLAKSVLKSVNEIYFESYAT